MEQGLRENPRKTDDPPDSRPPTLIREKPLGIKTRVCLFLLPLLISAAVIAALTLLKGGAYTAQLLGFAGAQFAMGGKFMVFLGLEEHLAENGFTPLFFMVLIVYMDLLVGSLVMVNVSLFYRLPWIGGKLRKIHDNSEEIIAKNPWVRKATFISLLGFVAFPLTGTGAIGGAFFGRMLGLTRGFTFLGLILGSLAGAGLMLGLALAFGNLYDYFKSPWARAGLFAGGLIVIAGFIYVLSRRLKKGNGE